MTMTMQHHTGSTRFNPLGLAKRAIATLDRWPEALIALPIRLAVASVFWRSGLVKISSWETTVQLFRDEYRVPLLPPEFAAYLGTATELTAPVLLAVGLGARFGAAALLGMTAVIQTFVYPESWPDHILWAALLLYVLTRGAGALSLDAIIARRFGR